MPKARPLDALIKLGKRIRARRVYMQLPLGYTAVQMKLSTSMLSDYEHGKGHPPSLTLLRMAKVLGTSTSDLLAERNAGNAADVHHALELMGDVAIHAVANTMHNMPTRQRHAVAAIVATIAAFQPPSSSPP